MKVNLQYVDQYKMIRSETLSRGDLCLMRDALGAVTLTDRQEVVQRSQLAKLLDHILEETK